MNGVRNPHQQRLARQDISDVDMLVPARDDGLVDRSFPVEDAGNLEHRRVPWLTIITMEFRQRAFLTTRSWQYVTLQDNLGVRRNRIDIDSDALDVAKRLHRLGFNVLATSGTAGYLRENGLDVKAVHKVTEGRPHIVDHIKNGEVALDAFAVYADGAYEFPVTLVIPIGAVLVLAVVLFASSLLRSKKSK